VVRPKAICDAIGLICVDHVNWIRRNSTFGN